MSSELSSILLREYEAKYGNNCGIDVDEGCVNSVCCIHRLPSELLSRIFEFSLGLESNVDSYGFPIPTRSTAPLLLTWICSYWRRLSISFPALWTSISLGPQGSDPSSDDRILDVFISRSGDTLPLSVALNYDQPLSSLPRNVSLGQSQSESYLSNMHLLASRLVSARHRWRHLTVNALILDALRPFLQALTLGTPMLEYLSVSTKYTAFFGIEHTLDLKSCSQLRTVRILSPLVFFDPSLPLLRHLTTLELHFRHSMLDAFAWLSSCPNLEKLSMELYGSLQQEHPSVQQIRLSRLTHLSLTCFYGESDPRPLFDALTAPSLYSLEFCRCRLSCLGPDHSWQNIMNLLRRSDDPPLRKLCLIDTPETSAKLMQVLQLANGVEHLVLGGDAVTDELLQRVSAAGCHSGSTSASPLCPRLESLELLSVAASFPSIIALASSRAQVPEGQAVDSDVFKTLKKLTFSEEILPKYSQHTSIRPLFPHGLSVVLK